MRALQVISLLLVCAGVFSAVTEPERCCFERQFKATLVETPSITADTMLEYDISMDFDRQLEGTRTFSFDPKNGHRTELSRQVIDNANLVTYTISGGNQCTRTTMTAPVSRGRCDLRDAGAAAQYMGTAHLGPLNGGVTFDSWRIQTGNLTVVFAFSNPGCVPVLEGYKGDWPGTGGVNSETLWVNYEPRITDSTVFDIPSSCNHGSSDPVGK